MEQTITKQLDAGKYKDYDGNLIGDWRSNAGADANFELFYALGYYFLTKKRVKKVKDKVYNYLGERHCSDEDNSLYDSLINDKMTRMPRLAKKIQFKPIKSIEVETQ